jgi:hypothetical protein
VSLFRRYIADLLIDVLRGAAYDVFEEAAELGSGLGKDAGIPPLPPPMLRDVAALDTCLLGEDVHRSAVEHEVRAQWLPALSTWPACCRGIIHCALCQTTRIALLTGATNSTQAPHRLRMPGLIVGLMRSVGAQGWQWSDAGERGQQEPGWVSDTPDSMLVLKVRQNAEIYASVEGSLPWTPLSVFSRLNRIQRPQGYLIEAAS